jgi:hypothetical protein
MSVVMGQFAPSLTSVAGQYAALAQWFSNALLSVGLVRVASSKPAVASGPNAGAADYTGVANPTTAATALDWEIWRLADALHATTPIYFRIYWKTGAATAQPLLGFSVGTGWDGVSAVNGNTFANIDLMTGGTGNTPFYCVVSGANNRVAVALWAGVDAGVNTSLYIIFGVERLHNADGSDNDEGVFVFAQQGNASTITNNQVVSRPTFGANATLETRVGNCLITRSNTTMYGADAGVGPFFPMRGKALYPSRNFIFVGRSDLGAGGMALNLDHYYGITQKWYNCARSQNNLFDGATGTVIGPMMRFD